MPSTKWSFEADYLQACNCEYGCPCEFQAPPSLGFCEGLSAWRISRGNFGEIPLAGLGFAFAARWPKAIHLGGGTAAIYFDERATPAQRDALIAIATGKAGGIPFEVIATTFSTILPFQFVPFTFHLNGKNSSLQAGSLKLGLTPIKNPVTGEPEGVRIQHDTGFVFQTAEVVEGQVCEANVAGLKFSWPNKAGFVAKVRYSN